MTISLSPRVTSPSRTLKLDSSLIIFFILIQMLLEWLFISLLFTSENIKWFGSFLIVQFSGCLIYSYHKVVFSFVTQVQSKTRSAITEARSVSPRDTYLTMIPVCSAQGSLNDYSALPAVPKSFVIIGLYLQMLFAFSSRSVENSWQKFLHISQ